MTAQARSARTGWRARWAAWMAVAAGCHRPPGRGAAHAHVRVPATAPRSPLEDPTVRTWLGGRSPAASLRSGHTVEDEGRDMAIWSKHGDGVRIGPGEVVGPHERLSWPRTIGIGTQHVVAMFGATFLVPLITGFPPSTTLFFSAVGTILFLVITRNRVPSYLGSSFAFIAPIGAATEVGGMPAALGGILVTGVLLGLVGLLGHVAGSRWIDAVMPPIVTGTVVMLIGFNLAPNAWDNVSEAPVTALVTIAVVVLMTMLFKGILGRLAILVGVLAGYVVAVVRGEVDFDPVSDAAWFGLPTFTAPTFDLSLMGLFIPVVFVLVAENVGPARESTRLTGENLEDRKSG